MSYSYRCNQAGDQPLEDNGATSPVPSITVLVVDAHALVSSVIAQLLATQEEIKRIATARNYIQARECTAELRPEIIWLDIHIGNANGLQEIQRLKRLAPTARIMTLTDLENEQEALEVIMAGAQGYRSQEDIEPDDILTIISMLRRSEYVLSPGLLARLIQRLRDMALPLWASENKANAQVLLRQAGRNDLAQLTDREREVLRLISQGSRDRDVAQGLGITEQTVQKHVQNILSKLGVQNRTQAAYLFYHGATM